MGLKERRKKLATSCMIAHGLAEDSSCTPQPPARTYKVILSIVPGWSGRSLSGRVRRLIPP